MTRIEQTVKVICVFLLMLFTFSSLFFYLTIGDPFSIVSWFGFVQIRLLSYHLISFSTSLVLAGILAGISYIQWKRESLSMTSAQILLYSLVIGIAICFIITSHSYLLPATPEMAFFFDIIVGGQVLLFCLLIGVLIWIARGRRFFGEPDQLADQRRELQGLSNQVSDGLYELEKENAHPIKRFFLKYMAHHFWVGVLLLCMGGVTQSVNPNGNYGTALMWFIIGGFLVIDDGINHLFHKSFTNLFPRRIKNERAYDQVGKLFTVICIMTFLFIALVGLYAYFFLR